MSDSKVEEKKQGDGGVSDDKKKEDKGDKNWLLVTPSWFGGNGGAVGPRLSSINALSNGIGLLCRDTFNVNLPIDVMWSAFDNFLELQNGLKKHGSHESGPVNKVGEILKFKVENPKSFFGLTEYFEELITKDDKNYIWRLNCAPLGKGHFKKYYYTVRLYNDTLAMENCGKNGRMGGCLVVIDMEFIFDDSFPEKHRNFILSIGSKDNANNVKYYYDFALNKAGTHIDYEVKIDVPIEWLFNYLSDFNNMEWVLSAKADSIKLLQPDIRSFETKTDKKILERISECKKINEENYIFEYQILDSMPLRDTLNLKKINDKKTCINGKISFYCKQDDKEAVSKAYQSMVDAAQKNLPTILENLYKKQQK